MNVVCNRRSWLCVLAVLLVSTSEPGVAAAEVVTLHALEELALRNQARWEAAEAATREAGAEVDAARALGMPTFWLNANGAIAPGSDIERVPTVDGREVNVRASPTIDERTAFRPNFRYEGIIQMRAPIYDGQTRASLRAAEAYRAAAEASSDASRETVLVMVRAAYLDWLATHLDDDFAKTASTEAANQRKRTQARVDDGERPPSDLDAARYHELEAGLRATEAAAKLAAAKALLESAVGTSLPPNAEPDTELLAIDSAAPDSRLKREIEVLELQRDAARREAEVHRKSRVPILAVVGQTGLAGVNEQVFPMYRLGLDLSVPLWDGGRAVSLARAADARAAELDARARDARLQRDDERTQAGIERQNAEAQLVLVDDLVGVSEKRVDQARTSYELGAGDLDAVADARAALRDAQSRRVQIQVARVDAILRLDDTSHQ